MKILIVDDAVVGRSILRELLQSLGDIEVAEAENGEQGIAKFKKFKPEIVITDIEMPVMDGITMAAEIRAHNSLVKIIVVSSVVNKKITQKALLNGASEILAKPIDEMELKKVIVGGNGCI